MCDVFVPVVKSREKRKIVFVAVVGARINKTPARLVKCGILSIPIAYISTDCPNQE